MIFALCEPTLASIRRQNTFANWTLYFSSNAYDKVSQTALLLRTSLITEPIFPVITKRHVVFHKCLLLSNEHGVHVNKVILLIKLSQVI